MATVLMGVLPFNGNGGQDVLMPMIVEDRWKFDNLSLSLDRNLTLIIWLTVLLMVHCQFAIEDWRSRAFEFVCCKCDA